MHLPLWGGAPQPSATSLIPEHGGGPPDVAAGEGAQLLRGPDARISRCDSHIPNQGGCCLYLWRPGLLVGRGLPPRTSSV